MSKQSDPAKIGLFIVGALMLMIAMVLVFSKAQFLTDKQKFVTFFSGSINGLNVGAPIKMKGVPIGAVTNIVAQYDSKVSTFITPVYFEIEMDHIDITHDELFWKPRLEHIETMIEQGLRARLNIQSLVTGQLYVELDFFPTTPVTLIGDTAVMEIPAIPSEVEELKSDLDFFIRELKEAPILEITKNINKMVVSVNHLLETGKLQETTQELTETLHTANQLIKQFEQELDPLLANFNATLTETRTLVGNVNHNINPVTRKAEGLLDTMQTTVDQVKSGLAELQQSTGQDSPLMFDLSETLHELTKAARSLRMLTDTLQEQPDALIYGKSREQ